MMFVCIHTIMFLKGKGISGVHQLLRHGNLMIFTRVPPLAFCSGPEPCMEI